MPAERELAEKVAALAVNGGTLANIRREVERLFAEEIAPEEAVKQLRGQFGGDEAAEILVAAVLLDVNAQSDRMLIEHRFMATATSNIADVMRANGAATFGDLSEDVALKCIEEAALESGLSPELGRQIFFDLIEGRPDAS